MLNGAALRLVTIRPAEQPLWADAVPPQLGVALGAAALLETLLLRLVTRVGVHLPRGDAISEAFQSASFLGSLAFNFASLLAIALVVLILGSVALRTGSRPVGLAVTSLSLSMLWGLGLSLATGSPAADALFGLSTALLVGLMGLVLAKPAGGRWTPRLALALMVTAYLCYQYYTLAHLLYRILDYPALPPLSVTALRLGEGLVVAAGFAVFWAWGAERWRRVGPLGMMAVAALVLAFALAALSPTSTTAILALWTTGLSLFLPFPLYMVSLALYLLTLVACWRRGDALWTASGLLLLVLAGYMPEATYHHLLLVLGVAFLSGAAGQAAPSSAAGQGTSRI